MLVHDRPGGHRRGGRRGWPGRRGEGGYDHLGRRRAVAERGQDIHLAQLGDDLLGRVSLARHRGPPRGPKPYLRADHFGGGGSTGPGTAERTRATDRRGCTNGLPTPCKEEPEPAWRQATGRT